MEDFGPHADSLGDAGRSDRHDHEFLNVDRVVSMFAAVDDVHHRHRQNPRRGAADISEQGQGAGIRSRLGDGHRHAQNGVRTQTALVVGAVQFDHRAVDGLLFGRIEPGNHLRDFSVYGIHGAQHTLATIAAFVAVALFHRFIGPGRSA